MNGLFGNGRGVGDPTDITDVTTAIYYAPAIIVSTVTLNQAPLQQSARVSAVAPGLRDAFLIITVLSFHTLMFMERI